MSIIDTSTAPLRLRLARGARWIAFLFGDQSRTWRQRVRKRRSLRHLSQLESWQLDDIGLSRDQVDQALREVGLER